MFEVIANGLLIFISLSFLMVGVSVCRATYVFGGYGFFLAAGASIIGGIAWFTSSPIPSMEVWYYIAGLSSLCPAIGYVIGRILARRRPTNLNMGKLF